MAKFSYKSKLSSQEQEELLMDLCDAISSVNDSKEAARFLKDLISPQEAEMLAKRIKIAELLLKGWRYKEIRDHLKVGEGTIARISEWLKFTGDGYRLIIKRLKEKRSRRPQPESRADLGIGLKAFKSKYPSMFWPELLIKDLIKSSKIKNKNKILTALAEMRLKPKLYKQIERGLQKS